MPIQASKVPIHALMETQALIVKINRAVTLQKKKEKGQRFIKFVILAFCSSTIIKI